MRTLLAAGAVALAAFTTTAPAKAVEPIGFGGNQLCYQVEHGSDYDQAMSAGWAFGFISGINSALNSNVGWNSSAIQVRAMMDELCIQHPQWNLGQTVIEIYQMLGAKS